MNQPDWVCRASRGLRRPALHPTRITGGLDQWGFGQTSPAQQVWIGATFVLMDQMLARGTEVLDGLLKAMTDEQVPVPTESVTETFCDRWAWAESSRRKIRWQVGGVLARRLDQVAAPESAE